MGNVSGSTGVAGTGVAGTAVAGTGVAGTGVAGTGVAGTAVAGTAVAGTGVAGTGVAGTGVAVRVGVEVGVNVGPPGVMVAVGVGVRVGVNVGPPGVMVAVGVGVRVGVAVGVNVGPPGVTVAVRVGVVVGVAVGVAVAVEVGVRAAAQIRKMLLESNVTAPVYARARPFKLAPVCRAMDVDARIFPINEVFVPRVAELTTRHHTLHGSPPTILAVPEVMRVAADLKIQTPDPLRVSVPDNVKASAQ